MCRSISTDRRRRRPCSPDAAVHPPSGSHPAHSASDGSRKRSAPSPPRRSVPNQLCGGLRHPVPNGRDSERPLSAPGFGIVTLRTGCGWYVLSCSSFPSPFNHSIRPAGPPTRWPRSSPHPLRRALVGLRQHVRVDQNVFAVYLVVELMKTESRLLLRLSIQFDPQVRILSGVARLIATHRPFPLHKHTRSKGPSLPRSYRLHRYLWPFPTPRRSATLSGGVRGSRLRDIPGLPH